MNTRIYKRPSASVQANKPGEPSDVGAGQSSVVKNILGRLRLLAKLKIGKPNDKYEQEADDIAERIIRDDGMPESVSALPAAAPLPAGVQRLCEECEEELQRKAASDEGLARSGCAEIEQRIGALGPGNPLPERARQFFQPRFRQDFGDVRIHTGNEADRLNRALNALAFTKGRNIYFAAGQFSPDTAPGKKILAHELTHVVQQSGGDVRTKARCDRNHRPKLSTPGPLIQRYSRDVHFDLTQTLALGIGFSAGDAHIIAAADQSVDEGWTHPWWRTPQEMVDRRVNDRDLLHFPARSVAEAEVKAAIRTCNLRDFGRALHRYQDSYSHGFPPGVVSKSRIATSYCWILNPILAGKILLSNPLYGSMAVLKHVCLGTYPDDYMKNPEQRARDTGMRDGSRHFIGLLKASCAAPPSAKTAPAAPSSPATPLPAIAGLSFSSKSFNAGRGGKINVTPQSNRVELMSPLYNPSGKVGVTGGSDVLAKDWDAGFIQTVRSSQRKAHYIGSKAQKVRSVSIPGARRDAFVQTGAPWYDPTNINASGPTAFQKTSSTVSVQLKDNPMTTPPWDTPDGQGKLAHHTGRDVFTAWMIARQRSAPHRIQYINWNSWQVDWGVTFNYASKGAKTVKKITGKTTDTGSGNSKGKNTPVLNGTIANKSVTTVWS